MSDRLTRTNFFFSKKVYGGMGQAVAVGVNQTYSTVKGPAVVYLNDCTNWSYPSYASSGVGITC